MAFQSLYRRYRPQRFEQIVGQEHVVAALRNAAAEDRLGHAYLFSGPRGTGKTSTARILAKVLNCEHPVDGEPDGTCPACTAIEAGSSFDVTELDAASHTGVDNMRDLIASTALASPGRTRLYILDEVHMLSKGASAALLKTLEEPPDHVVFILATTDPEKVLPTIRSRTQHLEFRLLPAAELEAHVRWIIEDAGLEVSEDGIAQALREGGGSARDTLSALDRIVAAGGVARSDDSVDDLLDAICESDAAAALAALADATNQGRDPRMVGERVLDELRSAFLASMRVDLSHLSERQRAAADDHAARLRAPVITRALEVLGTALVDMRQAPDPRIPLEVALVRITRPESDTSVEALLARIERLESAVRDGDVERLPEAAGTPGRAAGSPAAEARSRLAEAAKPDPEPSVPEASPVPDPTPVPDVTPVPDHEAVPEVEAVPDVTPVPEREAVPDVTPVPDVEPVPDHEPVPDVAPVPDHEPVPEATPVPDLPSRDDLTLAWGDRVLTGLRPKVKMLYASGRFVEHSGAQAAFALPNAPHVERCEPLKADVEAALAVEFGRPVPLVLVVEGSPEAETTAPAAEAATPAADAAPADELAEIGPVDELEDAGKASTGLDQVTDIFGKVELLDEEEESG
jgi:DNA polymerase-3 subunit gamma/tau